MIAYDDFPEIPGFEKIGYVEVDYPYSASCNYFYKKHYFQLEASPLNDGSNFTFVALHIRRFGNCVYDYFTSIREGETLADACRRCIEASMNSEYTFAKYIRENEG